MVLMAPAMLFAALVPIGALVFVQAEHDTRGFSDLPSPDEALAEQIRKQNQGRGIGPRNEMAYAEGTRSREILLRGNDSAYVRPPVQPPAAGRSREVYQQQGYYNARPEASSARVQYASGVTGYETTGNYPPGYQRVSIQGQTSVNDGRRTSAGVVGPDGVIRYQ